MAQLVYRTSGRKIKPNFSTTDKIRQTLQTMGLSPKQASTEMKWQELKMQVAKINAQ